MDGIKEVQDQQRKFKTGKGSFDVVVGNLQKYYKDFPGLVVRLTFGEKTVSRLFESIKLLWGIVDNVNILPVQEEEWRDKYQDILINQLNKVAELYLDYKDKDIKKSLNFFDAPSKLGCVHSFCVGCTAGKTLLAVSPTGDIFPCQKFYLKGMYKLGSLNSGINRKDIKGMFERARIDNYIDCSRCSAINCPRCMAVNQEMNGNIFFPAQGFCRAMRAVSSVVRSVQDSLDKRGLGIKEEQRTEFVVNQDGSICLRYPEKTGDVLISANNLEELVIQGFSSFVGKIKEIQEENKEIKQRLLEMSK